MTQTTTLDQLMTNFKKNANDWIILPVLNIAKSDQIYDNNFLSSNYQLRFDLANITDLEAQILASFTLANRQSWIAAIEFLCKMHNSLDDLGLDKSEKQHVFKLLNSLQALSGKGNVHTKLFSKSTLLENAFFPDEMDLLINHPKEYYLRANFATRNFTQLPVEIRDQLNNSAIACGLAKIRRNYEHRLDNHGVTKAEYYNGSDEVLTDERLEKSYARKTKIPVIKLA